MKRHTYSNVVAILLLLIAFLGLHKAWEKLIDHTIVKWLYLYFDNSIFLQIAVVIGLLVLFLNVKKVKWDSMWIYFYSFLYWCYYRFLDKHWTFDRLCHIITYFDLFVFPLILCIVRKVYNMFSLNTSVNTKGQYEAITDNPIENKEEDILNRKVFVESFSKRLVKDVRMGVCNQSAYSISINAVWGDGKTSFMNLVRKQIVNNPETKNQFEFVDFEPWMYPSNILSEFFNLLHRKVSPANYGLSNAITRYASVLEGTKASVLSRLLSAMNTRKTIREQFEIIKEGLSQIKKTYIIVVDDMDRLNGTEILEVFRLIRSSANFPHLVFVLLYDKQYVQNALKEIGSRYTDSFSDKFINTEFFLPSYNTKTLMGLAEQITDSLLADQKEAEKLKAFFKEKFLFGSKSIPEKILCTPRDIKRWLTSMIPNYINVIGDVEIEDCAVLELLKFKYLPIYNALKYKYEVYLVNHHTGLVLWNDKIELSRVEQWMSKNKRDIYQEKFFTELNVEDQNLVRMLLENLFTGRYNSLDTKHINNELFYHRYFYNCLQYDEISYDEYRQLICKEFEQLKSYVIDNKEKAGSIIVNIERDLAEDESDVLRNKVRTIFLIGALCRGASSPEVVQRLLDKLPENTRKDVLYSALTENGASWWAMLFISLLYRDHDYRPDWDCIISKEEITKAACEIFKNVLESDLSISEISDYYWHTNTYKNKQRLVNKEVTGMLKDYIKQNPDKMLSFLIYTDDKDYKVHKYYLSDYVEDFYSDINSMLKEFADDDRPSVSEFRDFVKQYQDNGNEPIQFQFTHIIKKRVE